MEQGKTGGIEQHATRLIEAVSAKQMTEQDAVDELRASWDITEFGAKDLVSGDYFRRVNNELGAR